MDYKEIISFFRNNELNKLQKLVQQMPENQLKALLKREAETSLIKNFPDLVKAILIGKY